MDIADKIIFWRKKRGYSTNKLAKKAYIAQSTLREIERKNTSPSWDTIEKLCTALQITTAQLIAANEPSTSEQSYDEKIKDLPSQAKKIIDTVIEVHQATTNDLESTGK